MIMDLIMAAGNGSELYRQTQKLVASDAAVNDFFGRGMAISSDGNTCAIGARIDDNSGGVDAGSVYIFVRTGDVWVQQQRLQATDSAAYLYFGDSVALSSDGNTCAIGCAGGVGATYIWTRTGSTWTQQQKISGAFATVSVALSADGNTCAIGSPGEDSSGEVYDTGAAYIWTRTGSTWTQQRRFLSSAPELGEYFGYCVALSADGNTLVVCAHQSTSSGAVRAGAAYIWTRTGSTWTQQQRLQASDAEANARFGYSVALSADGNTLVVGASQSTSSGASRAGAAYILTRTGSTWTQQQRLQASDAAVNDYFGIEVAISSDGNTCAITSSADDNSGGLNAGSVYILTRTGSTWTQQQRLQASDAATEDMFGAGVALSGSGRTCIAGARENNPGGVSNAGAAYVFLW